MKSQLEKAIKLARKTGDKIIIVDDENDSALAIMSLEEYEMLVDKDGLESAENIDVKSLTEEELLDKINRDIVMWQDKNKEKELEVMEGDFVSAKDEEEDEEVEEENMYYYDEAEKLAPIVESSTEKKPQPNKNSWQISSDVKNRAEEVK